MASKPTSEPDAMSLFPRHMHTELDQHLLCVNLDVLGVRLGRNACYVLGTSALESAIQAAARVSSCQLVALQDVSGSDSESFAWCGVPAVHFTREGAASSLEHTAGDVLALIDPGQLEIAGSLVQTFLRMTATESEMWPYERVVPESSQMKVKKAMGRMGWMTHANPSAQRGGMDATVGNDRRRT
jgi:hypothetical protein